MVERRSLSSTAEVDDGGGGGVVLKEVWHLI